MSKLTPENVTQEQIDRWISIERTSAALSDSINDDSDYLHNYHDDLQEALKPIKREPRRLLLCIEPNGIYKECKPECTRRCKDTFYVIEEMKDED